MLETVRQQTERLIAAYENERMRCESLGVELEQTRSMNETYRKRISELERQIDNLKLKEAFVQSSADGTEAKRRIDGIVKEIDKCISLMEG